VNITAINLNKMTLNGTTVRKIKRGDFRFVYLVSDMCEVLGAQVKTDGVTL
jgi:hypothetical protein